MNREYRRELRAVGRLTCVSPAYLECILASIYHAARIYPTASTVEAYRRGRVRVTVHGLNVVTVFAPPGRG